MTKDVIGYTEEIVKMRNVLFTSNPSKLTLEKIIIIFREIMDGKDSPLDGDGVELLSECLNKFIDLHEGNITNEEYEQDTIIPDDDSAYVCPVCGENGESFDDDFGVADGCRTLKCTNEKCNAEWEASYILKYVGNAVTDGGDLEFYDEDKE